MTDSHANVDPHKHGENIENTHVFAAGRPAERTQAFASRTTRTSRTEQPSASPLHPSDREDFGSLYDETGYAVRRRIGAGGMGIVYLAEDGNGNEVALKMLRPEIADDSRARARLRREVHALQRMKNDNIARVIDAELDSSHAFVVTEFIPGPTLEDAVREHGALHLEAVREIGVVLGETLQDIHAQGIIHRDLKPSNILLRHARTQDLVDFEADGERLDPVIIDFGISQAAGDSRLTATGMMMGTAAYLDPEVVKSNTTDSGSDWWAWAALLAFAATGREPFGSGRIDVVFLRAERGDVDVEGLPWNLQELLKDALQPDPSLRRDPAELIERLALLDFAAPRPEPLRESQGANRGAAYSPDGSAFDGGNLPFEATTASRESLDEATVAYAAGSAEAFEDDNTHVLAAADYLEPATELLHGSYEQHTTRLDTEPYSGSYDLEDAPTQLIGLDSVNVTRPMPTIRAGLRPQEASQSPHVNGQHPYGQQIYGYAHESHAQQPYAHTPFQPQSYAVAQQQSPLQHPQSQAPYAGGFTPTPPPMPAHYRAPNKRHGLVALGTLIIIGLGAISPLGALCMIVLLTALARTWQRSWVGNTRSIEGGNSAGAASAGVAALALPRLVGALLESLIAVLVAGVCAALAVVLVDSLNSLFGGAPIPMAALGAAFTSIVLLGVWWGIGARTTRWGAHRLVDSATPDALWTSIIALLLVVIAAALAFTIMQRGGSIDYFPYVGTWTYENFVPWRH